MNNPDPLKNSPYKLENETEFDLLKNAEKLPKSVGSSITQVEDTKNSLGRESMYSTSKHKITMDLENHNSNVSIQDSTSEQKEEEIKQNLKEDEDINRIKKKEGDSYYLAYYDRNGYDDDHDHDDHDSNDEKDDNSTYKNNPLHDPIYFWNKREEDRDVSISISSQTIQSDIYFDNYSIERRNQRFNWRRRIFSSFTPGGVRYSTVLFICTAVGVGFLSIPFVFSKLGIILSFLLIILNALESYVTTNILCYSSLKYNTFVYGNLIQKFGKRYHKYIIDIGLIFGFVSSYILILILISNFMASFYSYLQLPPIYANHVFLVILICILEVPIMCKQNVEVLNYFLRLSLIALVFTIATITIQLQFYYTPLKKQQLKLFHLDHNFFKCFNILLFSFSQQPNACFITGQFKEPTNKRIQKSTFRSIVLQIIFYTLFGLVGYMSFLESSKDNIILNYEESNIFIIFCKVFLSITFFFTIPLNFISSYQSVCSLINGLYSLSLNILNRLVSPNQLRETLLTIQGNPLQPLEETSSPNNIPEEENILIGNLQDPKTRIIISIIITIVCALFAIYVKNFSNVISIGGGITSSIISCILPNLIYFKNRHTVKNKWKKYSTLCLLFFFSFMSLFCVLFSCYEFLFSLN